MSRVIENKMVLDKIQNTCQRVLSSMIIGTTFHSRGLEVQSLNSTVVLQKKEDEIRNISR